MGTIKKFNQFVNEDYSFGDIMKKGKSMMGKASDWASNLISKISNAKPADEAKPGDVKIIADGPNAGIPQYGLFVYGEGKSIVDQVRDFYAGANSDAEVEESEEEESDEESDEETHEDTKEDGDYGESTDDVENEVEESEEIDEDEAFLKYGPGGIIDISAEEFEAELINRFKTHTMVGDKVTNAEGEEEETRGYGTPLFIFGAPGIGKTEIVAQACEKLKVHLLFADLESMEPTDLLGVPSVQDLPSDSAIGQGVTRSNPPVFLPRDNGPDDKGGIYFFDELNRSSGPVLNAMLKLTDSRRLGTYVLPDKWLIVAAGNRAKDESDSDLITKMGTALKRRFDIYNYVPTRAGFVKHVLTSEKPVKDALGQKMRDIVLPELIAFFDSGIGEEYFHNLDPDSDQEIYASPASWLKASKRLFSYIKQLQQEKGKDADISAKKVQDIFATAVGGAAAGAFMKFYQISQNLNMNDIVKVFDSPDLAPLPPKKGNNYSVDDAYAMFAAIVTKSKELGKLTPVQFGNAVEYAIRINQAEFAASFINLLIAVHPYIKEDRTALKYLAKYHAKYIAPLDLEK